MKNTLVGLCIILFGCTSKPSGDSIMEPLLGTYYYAYASDGGFFVEENCTTKSSDKFVIEEINNVYILTQQGFDTVGYVVQTIDKNGSEILIKAFRDDIDGESEKPEATLFRFLPGEFVEMSLADRQSTLILVGDKEKYVYRTCEEAMLSETDTNPVTIPKFDKTTKEGQLLTEFFSFLNTDETHPTYFSEGQSITVELPGPGLYPVVDTISNDTELKKFILARFSNYSPEVMSQWYQQNLFFMRGLKFRCDPEIAGLFIEIKTDPTSKFTSAVISFVDTDEGEPQTQFSMYYEWDENQALVLSKIDLSDCSA